MDNAYYIEENGEQKGPYMFDELIKMDIDLHDSILSPSNSDWEDACDLPELFTYFEARGFVFPTEDNLASFWWRLLAYIIDHFILSLLTGFIFSLLATYGLKFNIPTNEQMLKMTPDQLYSSLLAILPLQGIAFIVLILYNSSCEASTMKGSFGKRLCGLVVVDIDGARLTYLNALGRSIGKALSLMLCGLGFLSIFFSERRQALHDYMAKTYVVKL
ncbi:putative RDD family membrane protein YckC [Mucilaginibacter frigoritolerans]|jgi:uncharacterized RDD family membrane protein YckC|uniref:Putative RDD family membrane protein YckC n=1 Tax=Mucilaginibacter frigoritolerans TaxID=652788 RepID=A0A562TMX4_9SPHI|nr:RDD family protein [Mucilaginibacter frigoritolerans]TWI94598.1 putative RDD family membrane protein YckC [Mucilaginibacter frigoritolerans]